MSIKNDESEFDTLASRFFVAMASIKEKESRNPEDADEFVFHLEDCLANLRELCALRDRPGMFSDEEAKSILQGVMYHAVPHLIAAARLYDYVPDFFKEHHLKSDAKRRAKVKSKKEKVRAKS